MGYFKTRRRHTSRVLTSKQLYRSTKGKYITGLVQNGLPIFSRKWTQFLSSLKRFFMNAAKAVPDHDRARP